MNQTIRKFPLVINGEQTIEMPAGAEILCVQVQNDIPCLWAIVKLKEAASEFRRIRTHGTGYPCGGGRYIGTYQLHDGQFVGHVFEV